MRDHSDPESPESEASAAAGQLAADLAARAARYGMRTEATDWAKVGSIVARTEQATAALARAVDDQPLRAIPPSRE